MSDTTETRTLSREEVVERLLAVIDAHPEATNPKVGATCRYTDPNDEERHCLVGQFAAEVGWPVPGSSYTLGAHAAACDYRWPVSGPAMDALSRAQSFADRATDTGSPWASIRDEIAALAGVAG